MAGDAAAYAALGLDPDADSAEIEQAYRRLIKLHHPDRDGGDASRAADINRAYRELRRARDLKEPLEFHERWPEARATGGGWVLVAGLLAVVTLGLLLSQTPFATLSDVAPANAGQHVAGRPQKPASAQSDPMDQPLHLAAIDGAASDALRLSRSKDEMALASASRDCHHALRSSPSLIQLDRCAAFDDAVVQLQDRDPLRDQGPFSELAVTGRLWSGATALSDDSLAIDGRLDRVRLRVELVLAGLQAGPSR